MLLIETGAGPVSGWKKQSILEGGGGNEGEMFSHKVDIVPFLQSEGCDVWWFGWKQGVAAERSREHDGLVMGEREVEWGCARGGFVELDDGFKK